MLRVQTDGYIAVIGCHPAFLVNQSADLDNVLPVLSFRLRHGGIHNCIKLCSGSPEKRGVVQ
jgi:hypothetical protein